MNTPIIYLATAVLCASASTHASDDSYRLIKGTAEVCQAVLHRKSAIEYLKPSVSKQDPSWATIKSKCPAFLKKERWMPYRNREFDDYELYSVDIDNDGSLDTVLYRRYDKEYFVTHRSADGGEYRKQEGMEVTEEFYKVDMATCAKSRIFGAYEKARLFKLDGIAYVEHVDPYDRGKALTIYRKDKGAGPPLHPQDALCLFQLP